MSTIREMFSKEIQEAAQSIVERLPLSTPQLRALDDKDVEALHELIKVVDSAASDNDKIAAVQKNAGAIVQLISKI